MRHLLLVCIVLLLQCCVAVAAAPSQTSRPPDDTNFSMSFVVVRSSVSGCEPNCPQWIQGKGKISWGSVKSLEKILRAAENRKLPIVLESRGGDIRAAMSLGRQVRKYDMTTAVGDTKFADCSPFATNCRSSSKNGTYLGESVEARAYCFSACPLVLLGGAKRIVGPMPYVGLHQPITERHPYIERYWETWRFVHGRKVITSRRFIKRIPLPSRIVAGLTPQIRKELTAYVKEMKASPQILDEMNKASPKDINLIGYSDGALQKLGLSTEPYSMLISVTSNYNCAAPKNEANCVEIK